MAVQVLLYQMFITNQDAIYAYEDLAKRGDPASRNHLNILGETPDALDVLFSKFVST
jgi:hypothetical protein